MYVYIIVVYCIYSVTAFCCIDLPSQFEQGPCNSVYVIAPSQSRLTLRAHCDRYLDNQQIYLNNVPSYEFGKRKNCLQNSVCLWGDIKYIYFDITESEPIVSEGMLWTDDGGGHNLVHFRFVPQIN